MAKTMEALIKVQIELASRIEKARINFKKSPKERLNSVQYLNTRLESAEELWAQFASKHMEIVQQCDSTLLAASDYMTGDVYDQTEELFIEYKADLKCLLANLMPSSSQKPKNSEVEPSNITNNNFSEHIRLPKISIPPFSGTYSEWITFRDLFTSLVHNNKSLDNVQRLHYLKGHLTGEAEQLLRHIPITQDNYLICWDTLEKRYNNKKYLSSCILKRLLSQRNISTESAGALKELLDTTNECLHGLKNLSIDISSWDIIVIHILCLKLDVETRKQWELRVSEYSEDLPTYSQFQEFLETRFRAFEFLDTKVVKNSVLSKSNHNNVSYSNNPKVHHVTAQSCIYCSDSHKIGFCKSFAKLDIDDRRSYVQSNNMCFNCLNKGHSVYMCRQQTRCRVCNKKHHSLLHPKNHTASTETNVGENHSDDKEIVTYVTEEETSPREGASNITTCFSTSHSQVLLATALVKAQSKIGSSITIRCLLDQGSQASFITESAVQLLGLKKVPHTSTITGLGSDSGALASKAVVEVNIQSLHDPNFVVGVNAFVLRKITSVLPENKIVELQSEFVGLKLADPTFDTPNKIVMLLGADVYGQIVLEGMIKGSPMAQRTALGWVISGPIQKNIKSLPSRISINHALVKDEMMKRFQEKDTLIVGAKERKREDLHENNVKRDDSDRVDVNISSMDLAPQCTEKSTEAKEFKNVPSLERKLEKKEELRTILTEDIEMEVEVTNTDRNSSNDTDLEKNENAVEENVVNAPLCQEHNDQNNVNHSKMYEQVACDGMNVDGAENNKIKEVVLTYYEYVEEKKETIDQLKLKSKADCEREILKCSNFDRTMTNQQESEKSKLKSLKIKSKHLTFHCIDQVEHAVKLPGTEHLTFGKSVMWDLPLSFKLHVWLSLWVNAEKALWIQIVKWETKVPPDIQLLRLSFEFSRIYSRFKYCFVY